METIEAKNRDILGKKVKNLRQGGILPAVVYGRGKKTEHISIDEKNFTKIWKTAGESSVINLELDSGKKGVLIHGIDMDPLTDKPRHVDFYEVDMTRKVEVDVPIEYAGESEAAKSGGVLVKVTHELRVEALPGKLPPHFEIDVSVLKNIGDAVHVKDIKIPEGVELMANPDDTIVFVEEPRKEEEEVKEEPTLEDIEVEKKGKEAKEDEEDTEEKTEKEEKK